MNFSRMLLVASLVAWPLHGFAAPTRSGSFLRGLFDQQWVAVKYDDLALTRGSKPEIRAFAQSELDMYRALGTKAQALDPGSADGILATLADGKSHDTNTRKLVDDTALLAALNGDRFDKEYLLRVVFAHQRMIRHDLREIDGPGGNPAMLDYAHAMLSTVNDQTETANNLYSGQVNPPGPPPR